jgi:hypothetical protein
MSGGLECDTRVIGTILVFSSFSGLAILIFFAGESHTGLRFSIDGPVIGDRSRLLLIYLLCQGVDRRGSLGLVLVHVLIPERVKSNWVSHLRSHHRTALISYGNNHTSSLSAGLNKNLNIFFLSMNKLLMETPNWSFWGTRLVSESVSQV